MDENAMHDPVREYLSQKRYAQHVIEGGLDYLINRWESRVDQIAREVLDDRDEYLDAMDTRRILAEALTVADEEQGAAVLPRLAQADQRFRALVLATEVCAWGASKAYRHDWTREREWWYWTRPRRVTYWPEHPELAVLKRIIDVGQTVTRDQTELTLVSLEMYAAVVLVKVGMTCHDARLPALLQPRRSPREAILDMRLPLVVTDDLGNRYENEYRGSYHAGLGPGDPVRWAVIYTIKPTIPLSARQISLTIAEVQIGKYRGVATLDADTLLTLSGPWEFTTHLQHDPLR